MITLPGFIDPHVHFRTPGQTNKEDFLTGTSAALAGGYTLVIDMPNNKVPITSRSLLQKKKEITKKQIVCDIGFHFGSLGDNLDDFGKVENKVFGLKLYLNKTTGGFIINKENLLKIYEAWPGNKPILVHAEEDVIDLVLETAAKTKKKTHICHISSTKELKAVIAAKKKGLPITCGITPHHLFLSSKEARRLGPFGLMKPAIQKDYKEFAWKNLQWIDCIESDHAPHTKKEKLSKIPPFGVPGLETTLSLLLNAYSEDKISIAEIKRLCHDGPVKIFNVRQDSKIIIDEEEEWVIQNSKLFTKSKWSPFNNWKVKGKVKKVYIRNKLVFDNGKVIAKPGSGRVL